MVTHSFVSCDHQQTSQCGLPGFLWEKVVIKASLITVKNLVKIVATVSDEGLELGDEYLSTWFV